MKRKLAIFLAVISVFLSGCQVLPQPEDAISPPKAGINISADNDDAESIAAGFLPEGAVIVPVNGGGNSDGILSEDLDGDGRKELILVYKSNDICDDSYAKLMILKKGSSIWEKIYDKESMFCRAAQGPVVKLDFLDITGDGAPEIFLSREMSLEVYITVRDANGRPETGALGYSGRDSYEVGDMPDAYGKDGIQEIVLKGDLPKKQLGTMVLRWNGFTIEDVTEEYPDYLKEEVEYWKSQVAQYPESKMRWDYLEFAQEKSKMFEEALKSCDKIIDLSEDVNQKSNGQIKRAGVLTMLGRYDEAINTLKAMDQNDTVLYNTAGVYETMGEYDSAREIYDSVSQFPYDENVQRIDAYKGEEKIYNYIKELGPGSMDKARQGLSSFCEKNGIIASCTAAEETPGDIKEFLAVDYIIDPSKAYGKEDIGGHILYWWDGENLNHQGYLSFARMTHTLNRGFYEDLSEGMRTDFTAAKAVIRSDGNVAILQVVYNDKTGTRTIGRMYHMINGRWKLFME